MPIYTFIADLRNDATRVYLNADAQKCDLRDDPTRVQIDFEAVVDDTLTWDGVPIIDEGEYLIYTGAGGDTPPPPMPTPTLDLEQPQNSQDIPLIFP